MKSILLGVLAVTAQACAAKATAEDDDVDVDVGISCCGPEIEKYWIETLSDEQNTQVESIFETQREKRLDLREETRTLIFLGLPPSLGNGTNRVGILLQNVAAVSTQFAGFIASPAVGLSTTWTRHTIPIADFMAFSHFFQYWPSIWYMAYEP